ncbi:MAG: hypothetical protein JW803_00445 [Endomicrobiales bacterium]|nr:hypothetical protein [Endomicrobiales bacterium]
MSKYSAIIAVILFAGTACCAAEKKAGSETPQNPKYRIENSTAEKKAKPASKTVKDSEKTTMYEPKVYQHTYGTDGSEVTVRFTDPKGVVSEKDLAPEKTEPSPESLLRRRPFAKGKAAVSPEVAIQRSTNADGEILYGDLEWMMIHYGDVEFGYRIIELLTERGADTKKFLSTRISYDFIKAMGEYGRQNGNTKKKEYKLIKNEYKRRNGLMKKMK